MDFILGTIFIPEAVYVGVVEDGKVGNAFLKEKFITVVLEKPEYNCSEVIYYI